MSKIPRKHHYISQCYLKEFTKESDKRSKFLCVDFEKNKQFFTSPKNVAHERDFNLLNIEGLPPDDLERFLGKIESTVPSAIKNIKSTNTFSNENRNCIINLIALFAIRNPFNRAHRNKTWDSIHKHHLRTSISDERTWKEQNKKLQEKGHIIDEVECSLEELKEFIESDQYNIDFTRESHIWHEFIQIQAILPYLFKRKWTLFKSPNASDPFITSNRPVVLMWKDMSKVPAMYQNSPGFGMPKTRVIFPLTRKLALIGDFEGENSMYSIEVTGNTVAAINTSLICNSMYQIYAPSHEFKFIANNNQILKGDQVLEIYKQSIEKKQMKFTGREGYKQ